MFELHPQLEADSTRIQKLPLCDLRLIEDANYPWFVLVPERPNIREIHELGETDQHRLTREISQVSLALQAATGAGKMNVAALGNLVPQLHIHVIARFDSDPAWPGPIWGVKPALPYEPEARAELLRSFREALGDKI